jgi:hypothetical protein
MEVLNEKLCDSWTQNKKITVCYVMCSYARQLARTESEGRYDDKKGSEKARS